MKITKKKLDDLIKSDKNWVLFADNTHGAVHWNEVTGAIIWESFDNEDDNNYTMPKIQPQR